MSSDNEAEVRVGGDTSGAEGALQKLAESTKQSLGGMGEDFTKLTSLSVLLGNALSDLAENIVNKVSAAVKESVYAYVEASQQIEHMYFVLGGIPERLSGLAVALKSIGVSTQAYEGIAFRLSMQLERNSEAFDKYGVSYKKASGELLDAPTIISNVMEKLQQFTAGSERNRVGTELMGRGWRSMVDLLNLSKEGMEEANQVAKDFALTMSQEDINAGQQFEQQVSFLQQAVKGFYIEIGRAIDPYLTDLATLLRGPLKIAFDGFKLIVEVVMGLVYGFSMSVVMLWHTLGTLADIAKLAAGGVNALGYAMMGNFKESAAVAQKAWEDYTNSVATRAQTVLDYANKVNSRMGNLINPPASPAETGSKAPGGGETGGADRVKEWKKELEEMKDAQELFHDLGKADEVKFWEYKLTLTKKGSAEYKSVFHLLHQARVGLGNEMVGEMRKTFAYEMALAKDNSERRIQIAQAERDSIVALYGEESDKGIEAERKLTLFKMAEAEKRRKLAMDDIAFRQDLARTANDLEMENISFMRSMGMISEEEKLQMLTDQKQRAFEIERQHLRDKTALYDQGTVEYQRSLEDITKLEQRHNLDLVKMQHQAQLEKVKMWENLFDGVANSFKNVAMGLATGTLTLRKATTALLNGIAGEFLSMGFKIVADWVKRQIMMTVFGQVQAAERVATAVAEATTIAAAQGAANQALISSYAGVAGAAGVSSAAAIPYYGWMIAPEAGMADYAAAMAFSGMGLLSAAGGAWEIPEDQLAMVHKKESILPANIAEPLRNMVEGGSSMGGGDTFVVQAIDSRSLEQYLRKNAASLGPALRRVSRNGVTTSITKTPTGKVY